MKKFVAFTSLFFLTACTTKTEHGKCIGFLVDEDPSLKYEISLQNTVLSLIGIELILPPALWVTHYAKCPTGPKGVK